MGRFECHAHTMYSNLRLLDCINFPDRLVQKAIELGLKGIAITDHEALGSHMVLDRIQRKLLKEGSDFKVARGNEIYLCDTRNKNQKYYHYILIAKDAIGHKMLRKLSSISWMNSYYDRGMERVPTLKSELTAVIQEFGKGHLIASSACLGSELDYLILERERAKQESRKKDERELYNKILSFVSWNQDLFDDDFYLEVQPARTEEQIIVNKVMGKLGRYCGVKVIVTTDAHYLSPEDREIHKIYLNSKGGEREVDAFYEYAYLQSTEEVIQNLAGTGLDYQELEKNTWEIYDKIENYTLAHNQHVQEVEVYSYPKEDKNSHFYNPEKYPTLDKLRHSDNLQERYWVNYCQEQLEKKKLNNEIYLARLEEEADIKDYIGRKLGTCLFAYPIFLQHYIDLFWECGSTVGCGRGSAGSGLNHYLLGVTQIDPVEWNLPFWRYLNKERYALPDVDIDLAPSKRELIFSKIRKQRGELGCVQVCTYGTETAKSALSTAARGMNIDNDIAQYMTSLVPQERGQLWPLADVINGNKKKDRKPVQKLLKEARKYPGFLEAAQGIEGLIKQRGIHASGVVFYGDDPFEDGCFMKATNGAMVTQFSLHDAEENGNVKYDLLVTEVQDVITQTIELLQKYGKIDSSLSLREAYDLYLHPTKLPLNDKKLWNALNEQTIVKKFQFDSLVGSQTLKKLKPSSVSEMATCNSIMRLMAPEKGAEQPTDRYARMKANIKQWYTEMDKWGLTKKEQSILEEHCLSSYGTPAQQEDVMMILMDKDICNFTLAEANDARKLIAKKEMSKIPELYHKVMDKATSPNLGEYVWEVIIKLQLGYSFSAIHTLSYSLIGLQTVYLATYFPSVYWNTACLRVDSGLEEEAASDYRKIAKAIGNMKAHGVNLSLVDINRSGYMFEPDEEANVILYGLKGLNGVGGEVAQQIIENRPYANLQDFQEKNFFNKTVMVSLIKAGAFDQFSERSKNMQEYVQSICEPKQKLTMQNFNGLVEKNILPSQLSFQKRLFVFNRALRKNCKAGDYFTIQNNYYDFYAKFFDLDLLESLGEVIGISVKTWKKIYDEHMKPAKDYLQKHQAKLLKKYNDTLFQEQWNKYACGTFSAWEMESLGFYYHEHELVHAQKTIYGIRDYSELPREPETEYYFKRGGAEIPIYKTCRIMGTAIAKDDNKSLATILTPDGEVVDVKFNRDYYAEYNRRISEIQSDGTKKIQESGWFQKGTLLVVNGFRREDMFVAKTYKRTPYHQLYKITSVNTDGTLDMTHLRWGEEE